MSSLLKYSNLHILLVAFGLIAGTYVLIRIPLSLPLLFAGCSGAFLVYQLDRCWMIGVEDKANQPERIAWLRQHQGYVFSSCIFFAVTGGIAALFLSVNTLLFSMLLAGVGVLYLLPVLPGGILPKSIWYLKPIVISGAWAVGSVLFPAVEAGAPLTRWIALLIFYRLFFILPNILLTDWLDRAGDRVAGHTSIAMLLPEQQLRMLAGIAALIALTLGISMGYWMEWPASFYIDLGGPISMMLICMIPLRQSRLLYGLILDIVVAWPVMTVLVARLV